MAKKVRRQRKLSKPERKSLNRRKVLMAACLGLSLVFIVGLVIARWGSSNPTSAHLASAPLAPQPSPTPALSKEYIYAGGKLLVTEESVPLASGGGGYALSLNGTNAYAQVNNSTSLNITGALTVEAWIKYTPNGTYQEIVARESYGQTGGGYALQISNMGKLRFILYQGGTAYVAVVGTTTLSTGGWHHVAGVFDGTSQRRVYLDGVEDGSASSAGSAPTSGTADLKIGRLSSNTLYYFNGVIDEVRISNSALYSGTFTPPTSLTSGASTKGLWKFDDQTADDSSGNGNDGTAQGGAAYSPDTP